MINFEKKTEAQPAPRENQKNRFEQIHKAAEDAHRKSDAEKIARRARSAEEKKDQARGS
jgi:hypothetical protein